MGAPFGHGVKLPFRLTDAGARSAQGANTGPENAVSMASVGARVEPTVRNDFSMSQYHS